MSDSTRNLMIRRPHGSKALAALATAVLGWSSVTLAQAKDEAPPVDDRTTEACTSSEFKDVDWLTAETVKVVDGDTLKIDYRNRLMNVRFLSIDTPETNFQGQTQGYWGDRATTRLGQLIPLGRKVKVELGQEKCDRYGRILGYVWIGQMNVNFRMVQEALAVNYCIAPNFRYCVDLARITEANVESERGIYGDSGPELPYEWRRQMSGRPHEKLVGNIFTKRVYPPGSLDRVPIGARVFFTSLEQVHFPYYVVD